jgi:hypothetical protein
MNDAQPYEKSMTPPPEDIPALLTRGIWLSASTRDLDLDNSSKTTSEVVRNAKKTNR